MTCAPAMKKSPKMPPSPFGSGQLFGCGKAGQRRGEQDHGSRPGEQPESPPVRPVAGRGDASPRPRAAERG